MITAQGNRIPWDRLPLRIRSAIEAWLGESVIEACTQTGGLSPGMAARLRTPSGRRVFVKAVGPEPNTRSPGFYRREAAIAALLPTSLPTPRLL